MAVYTKVPKNILAGLLSNYELGLLTSMTEIMEGVENSNYLITTEMGPYILTLYEKRVRSEDLPFFIGLMKHAALKGIPCPLPIADVNGEVLQSLCGKSAAILRFLEGKMLTAIGPMHCQQVGEALAHFHRATHDFKLKRGNDLSCVGWEKLVTASAPRANTVALDLAEFITNELSYLSKQWPATAALPQGVIHGDLFPDNVLFQGKKLYGLIDFYFSCNDALAYDLAICANAWCFENEEVFSYERMEALMGGYESVRPLSKAERDAMPLFLRGAALRFLLTRLYDFLNQPEGAVVKVKDPLEYYRKLQFFMTHSFERAKAVPTYKA